MLSIIPTATALMRITVTRKTGSKLWIISEEMPMNMLTNPRAKMPHRSPGGSGLSYGLIGFIHFVDLSPMAAMSPDDRGSCPLRERDAPA